MATPTTESELLELDSAQFNEDIFPNQSVSNASTSSSQKHRPRTRKRTAWIWKHMPNPDPEFLYSDPQNRIQWRCKYCPKIYLESGGTHAIVTHLEGHDIRGSSSKDSKASQVQTSIQ